MAAIYAPSYAAALFRQTLDYACQTATYERNRDENRAFFRRWVIDLAGIIPAEWCETIRGFEQRPLVNWRDRLGREHESFLSVEQRKTIEREQINYPDLDVKIPRAFQ